MLPRVVWGPLERSPRNDMALEPAKSAPRPPLAHAALRSSEWVRDNRLRLVRFGSVGVLGVGVNLLVCNLALFLLLPGFLSGDPRFLVANALGFVISVFTNFLLNDSWTWGDRHKGDRLQWSRRLGKYYLTASGAGLVQIVVAWLSLSLFWSSLSWDLLGLEIAPSLAVLTGIGSGMVLNFTMSHLWAFRDAPGDRAE